MENLSIEGFLGLIFGIVMIFRYKSWGREATNLYNNFNLGFARYVWDNKIVIFICKLIS